MLIQIEVVLMINIILMNNYVFVKIFFYLLKNKLNNNDVFKGLGKVGLND